MAELPLTGTRILDLTRLLPGPYATLLLADLGAQVDKLEDPNGGDPARFIPPYLDENSALFHALNRNKRSLALNLKSGLGASVFRRLVVHYDVVIESNRPGVLQRLGLAPESLLELNPRLIICSLSGYGQTGPDRLRPGHDLNYVARAGVLGYGGTEDAPAMPGGQTADIGGALFAAVGILAALEERHRTGRGRWIDVSLTESAMAFIHPHLSARALAGEGAPLLGRGRDRLNGGNPCYNIYRTKDGRWLSVGALEPKFAARFLAVLGLPMPEEFPFGPETARTLRPRIAAKIESENLDHWLRAFRDEDTCVEPISSLGEVLEDEHLRARANFQKAAGSPLTNLLTPLRFGRAVATPAPTLGQHSREILAGAGFSSEEIERLVIGEPS